MSIFRYTIILAFALFSTICIVAQERESKVLNRNRIQVEGTNLAKLNTATDILNKVPGVSIENNAVVVNGKDQTAVYINNRRILGISELNHLNASFVKSVTVITEPGSQYPSDIQAVVLIERVISADKGFHLNEHLQLSYNNNVNIQNDLSLSHISSKFTINGLLSYNLSNADFNYEEFYQRYADNGFEGKTLKERDHYVMNQNIEGQQIITRAEVSYKISENHQITARYEYLDQMDRDITNNPADIYYYRAKEGENLDFNNPARHVTLFAKVSNPKSNHSASLGYIGNLNKWRAQAQLDFISQAENYGNYNYLINKSDVLLKDLHFEQEQKYYNGKITFGRAVGDGNVLMGIEHNNIRHKNDYDNRCEELDKIHAAITDRTTGYFGSLEHRVGRFNVSAGVRYDHRFRSYKAYSDDETFKVLLDKLGLKPSDIRRQNNYFTGNINASTKIGQVAINASYNTTYIKPFKKHQLLTAGGNATGGEGDRLEALILDTEFQHSANISATWRWMRFGISYIHYIDPIFETVDNLKTFNGPDYDAMGLQLILAPKLGFYRPNVYMYLHKQWIYMETANGVNNLLKPKLTTRFVNTFVLPKKFIFDITANWQTKGSERNIRNYSPIFKIDASLQRDVLNGKLSLMLVGNNILNTFCNDITMYTPASEGTSSGQKREMPRTILLSVRFKL